MYKKSTLIVAIAILLLITSVGVSVGIYNFNKFEKENQQMQEEIKEENQAENDAQGAVKPSFIYFVSTEDEAYNEAIRVYEELKNEYQDRVNFDLKNITENPELLESFSIAKDNTPMLIMDTEEGFSGMKFKTSDKETLKNEIEKALNK